MKSKKDINIFIVDDNKVFSLALKADVEKSFKETLTNLGLPIEVHLFETGEKCLEQNKKLRPQIVILDYFLDGADSHAANGIEILDKLIIANPKVNVIMLTNNDHMEIAEKAKQHGACDYIVKTETKFKKINYSLANILRILKAEQESKSAKQFIYLFVIIIVIISIIVLAFQIYKVDVLAK